MTRSCPHKKEICAIAWRLVCHCYGTSFKIKKLVVGSDKELNDLGIPIKRIRK